MVIDDDDVLGKIIVKDKVVLVMLTPTLMKDGIRVIDASDMTDIQYIVSIPEPMYERLEELNQVSQIQEAITEVVVSLIEADNIDG
jgi:hypothetical protein